MSWRPCTGALPNIIVHISLEKGCWSAPYTPQRDWSFPTSSCSAADGRAGEANDFRGKHRGLPEERRRLYYVAMTRAVTTLTLLNRRDEPLPFAREVERWCRIRRRLAVAEPNLDATPEIHYTVLGMKHLHIDFAGEKHAGHPIHRSLARLQAGDPVTMQRRQEGRVSVLNLEGTEIARLSNAAAGCWQHPQLQAVSEVRILGMVVRERHDGAPEYQDRIAASSWELPILEVCHRPRIFECRRSHEADRRGS